MRFIIYTFYSVDTIYMLCVMFLCYIHMFIITLNQSNLVQ